MEIYEFGPFELDVERLLLLRDGEAVALGPKVVETLLALLEHRNEVLAKPVLLDRIWPEGFVEEANLAQNIYVLRKMFRAYWKADAIQTVPRRGYRFTAPVRHVMRATLPEQPIVVPAPRPASVATALYRRVSPFAAAIAFAAVAVVLIAGYGDAERVSLDRVHLSANGARLYQIGRYYWNLRTRNGVERSLSYFSQVVDSDPKSARGYAGLADANAAMGDYGYGAERPAVYFARARGYARKALAIDPRSAEAQAALGLIALDKSQNQRAIGELRRAIAFDPSYGPAREWYGIALMGQGKLAEGYTELKKAADLDPLSVATTAWLGSAAYLDRKFSDAIAYSRQALELSPQRTDVLTTLGEAYEAEGNMHRAIDTFKQYSVACARCRAEGAALLAHAYAGAHRMAAARAQLRYARAHAADVEPMDLAAAAAAIGERSVAIGELRRVKQRGMWTAIVNDPRFDVLRSDPEFRQMSRAAA